MLAPQATRMAAARVAAGFQPAEEPGFQPGGFRPADHAEDAEKGTARSENAAYRNGLILRWQGGLSRPAA